MRILECAQIRKILTHVECMAEADFLTESSICGYHVYQEHLNPVIEERLNSKREEGNTQNRYAVAIKNSGYTQK